MWRKSYKISLLLLVALSLAFTSFAQTALQTDKYDVKANIPQQNGFNVDISKIAGANWSPAGNVDFGELWLDSQYNVFRSDFTYAVDVGITANVPSWTIQHTRTSVVRTGGTETLDQNINVVFVKQTGPQSAIDLNKYSYLNSDGIDYTNLELAGGWLRIFYGIGTGDANDAPGVLPIGLDKPAGDYLGQVTLTLFQT
ncbi:MAG: hypothetical protein K9L86_08165 [Candidatus Omnitrophica bacterium]|nr:hypothetical protein [Candidatus Omnitrophota bacterium]